MTKEEKQAFINREMADARTRLKIARSVRENANRQATTSIIRINYLKRLALEEGLEP